jgi:hypothetical protein
MFSHPLIIPILPCVLIVVVKLVVNMPYGWNYIDKVTLTFSLCLYCLNCLQGAHKIEDDKKRTIASNTFIVCLITSAVLFGIGIYLEASSDVDVQNYINSGLNQTMQIFVERSQVENDTWSMLSLVLFLPIVLFSENICKYFKIERDII